MVPDTQILRDYRTAVIVIDLALVSGPVRLYRNRRPTGEIPEPDRAPAASVGSAADDDIREDDTLHLGHPVESWRKASGSTETAAIVREPAYIDVFVEQRIVTGQFPGDLTL
jgi:hypothetical protein